MIKQSVFGTNDWFHRILPNMAQDLHSVMVEFSYNSTMEWLKNQGEQKCTLIALAQRRRQSLNNQEMILSNFLSRRWYIEQS